MSYLISETQQTARKPHWCDSCYQQIPKGTRYNRQFCVDGGDAWSWIEHLDCRELACELHKIWGFDEGIPPLADIDRELFNWDEWRGRFPHVITRLELEREKAALQWARREAEA